jgi:hypothetical protein
VHTLLHLLDKYPFGLRWEQPLSTPVAEGDPLSAKPYQVGRTSTATRSSFQQGLLLAVVIVSAIRRSPSATNIEELNDNFVLRSAAPVQPLAGGAAEGVRQQLQ